MYNFEDIVNMYSVTIGFFVGVAVSAIYYLVLEMMIALVKSKKKLPKV